MSVDLFCLFRMALWKKEDFSLLVSDRVYLGPDGVGRPKVLSLGITRGGKPLTIYHYFIKIIDRKSVV